MRFCGQLVRFRRTAPLVRTMINDLLLSLPTTKLNYLTNKTSCSEPKVDLLLLQLVNCLKLILLN